jgi:hypothetical protein
VHGQGEQVADPSWLTVPLDITGWEHNDRLTENTSVTPCGEPTYRTRHRPG